MSEKELLSLLKNKDNKGFKYVIHKYFPMCRKQMRHRGMSTEDMQDLFQESIIVLYEKLQDPNFTLTSKVSTYLYGVCQKKTLESLRKPHSSPLPEKIEEKYVYEDEEAKQESDDAIREALLQLGNNCKELLAAYYYYKTRIKELQIELGYNSENSTKQAKYKCIQRLKDKLTHLRS